MRRQYTRVDHEPVSLTRFAGIWHRTTALFPHAEALSPSSDVQAFKGAKTFVHGSGAAQEAVHSVWHWSPEEDALLRQAVERSNAADDPRAKTWSIVAESVPGRINKQCRERWHSHLSPGRAQGPLLGRGEDRAARGVRALRSQVGRHCKCLPGRTDTQVKNFFNLAHNGKRRVSDGRGVDTVAEEQRMMIASPRPTKRAAPQDADPFTFEQPRKKAVMPAADADIPLVDEDMGSLLDEFLDPFDLDAALGRATPQISKGKLRPCARFWPTSRR